MKVFGQEFDDFGVGPALVRRRLDPHSEVPLPRPFDARRGRAGLDLDVEMDFQQTYLMMFLYFSNTFFSWSLVTT